jgi:flavin-dependent dehydrogenase
MEKVGLESTILSDVWGARMHAPSGHYISIGQPDKIREHVVCRKLFDQGVTRLAIESGANIWLGARAVGGQVEADTVSIEVKTKGELISVQCRLLCGADGAHSWVRRWFKFGRPKEMMVGFQSEVTGYLGEPGILDLFTGQEVAAGLFAWVIPNGETHRIGLWVRPEDLSGRSCEHLYDSLINSELYTNKFANIKEIARYCGPIPTGFLSRIVKSRIALFGDAAAACKPTTGGGIGPGFAQVDKMLKGLISALNSDELDEKRLQKIAKPIKQMRRDQERSRSLRDLFLTYADDEELDRTFSIFQKPEVIKMINESGDIEKPVPLGLKMLKKVPEFRKMAIRASWAILTG